MNEFWVGRVRGVQDVIINTNAELNQFEGNNQIAPSPAAVQAVSSLANELRILAGELQGTLAIQGDCWDAGAVANGLHSSANHFDQVAAALQAKAQRGEAFGAGWFNQLWPAVQTLDSAVRALEYNEPWVNPWGAPVVAAFAPGYIAPVGYGYVDPLAIGIGAVAAEIAYDNAVQREFVREEIVDEIAMENGQIPRY